MSDKIQPAEVYHVGVFLAEELAERGRDVLWLVRRCPSLTQKRAESILAQTSTRLRLREAEEIASVLGINPAMLINLDRAWHGRQEMAREAGGQ